MLRPSVYVLIDIVDVDYDYGVGDVIVEERPPGWPDQCGGISLLKDHKNVCCINKQA